jgi:type I site-specific restriction-modification system R (restriction) subunit
MIVCMSRCICVDLYNALIQLRPEWKAGADVERTFQSVAEGTSWKTRSTVLKVLMTGSAEDGPDSSSCGTCGMLEKHGIACDLMHGFNWDKWTTGKPIERLQLIPAGQEHILEQDDGKKRWVQVVTELSRAFALCAASDEASAIRDDVSYFQALQAALNKQSRGNRKTPEQIDAAIRQLVSKAITTEGQVIDVFTAAGLPKPDI